MSETLLLKFMRVAHDITKADRAFAVNLDMTPIGTLNISPEQIEAPYLKCIQQTLGKGKPIITDNYTMTLDPSEAPVTNQSFPKLRFVVIIPVTGYGAICLDQSLSGGVTSKDKVDRLGQLINQIVENNQLDLEEAEILNLYDNL